MTCVPESLRLDFLCQRLQVAPAEAVFLDDVPACVEAARRRGMHAVLHAHTPTSIAAINAPIAA
jgi:HAD superfamily hydrolase (TIGR01509 family)